MIHTGAGVFTTAGPNLGMGKEAKCGYTSKGNLQNGTLEHSLASAVSPKSMATSDVDDR
jgi:hypothetical protein